MEIQSISDIITNSSTEVFIIETDKNSEEIFKEVLSWNIPLSDGFEPNEDEDCCGGWGDEIMVCDNQTIHSTRQEELPKFLKKRSYLEDNQVEIKIDRLRRATAHRIIETYNVIDQW